MLVTAREIAKTLGLSESAVSFALNNTGGISRQTRQKILETALEMGYDFSRKVSPNAAPGGKICFVVYKRSGAVVTNTPFFAELLRGVKVGSKREHYNCEIHSFYEDENIQEQIYELYNLQFSGIILLATEMTEESLKNFASIKIPLVILDAYFEKLPYNYVVINNVQGAFTATNVSYKQL